MRPGLAAEPAPRAAQIMGWVENAIIYPGGLTVRAKLDSGASTSSVHTPRQQVFRRDGRNWVRFTIDNKKGGTVDLELPVKRFVRIREHGGGYQRRPVVVMGICVGEILKETEINLVDRTGFLYPLLVGRRYLRGSIVIDPAATGTVEPGCPDPADAPDPVTAAPGADGRNERS